MVFRRGRAFWLRVPTSGGKRVQRSAGTTDARTAKAIQHLIDSLEAQRRWKLLEAAAKGTIDVGALWDRRDDLDALEVELNDINVEPYVSEWRPRSAKYREQVRALIPSGQPFPRSRLTRSKIREWLDGLVVTGSTRNRYRSALSSFCAYLVEREILTRNVVRDVKRDRENPARVRWLALADVERVLAASAEPYRAFFALLYGTGIEVSAALGVHVRDVDPATRAVHAKGSKTAWRNRVIYVEPWAWPFVQVATADKLPDAPLFPGVTERRALDAHATVLKGLKLEHATLHDARHSYAVRSLKAGVTPQVVKRQLGHAPNSVLIYRIYGVYIPDAADYVQQSVQHQGLGR